MTLLEIVTSSILPVFLVAAVGFALARFTRVDATHVARVVFNGLAPCLVFDLLATASVGGHAVWRVAVFGVLMMGAMAGLARILAVPLQLDRSSRAGFTLAVMFSNNANYGLPLVQFAFGDEALVFATIYFLTSAFLTYTVGVLIAAGGRRSPRHTAIGMLKIPTIYAAVAGGLVAALDVAVPPVLMRPVSLLSDAAVPLMLLVLGMQLAGEHRPLQRRAVGTATTARLLVAPLLAVVCAELLGLTGAARQAAILQASMPAAVITTVLALELGAAPRLVTSVIVMSTLLSPVTLTALVAWLQ